MWHSASAGAWLSRWDGGEGYQSLFLRRGYPVYIWDGPQVGRANWGCTDQHAMGRHRSRPAQLHLGRFGAQYMQWFDGVQFPRKMPRPEPARARALEFDSVDNAQLHRRRREADGPDRSEHRVDKFRRRAAGNPHCAEDEQPRRHDSNT